MIISINPDPIRVGQIGSLNIQLDYEKEGFYWFTIDGQDAPFPGGKGTKEHPYAYVGAFLKKDKGFDFEPEVQFSNDVDLYVYWVRGAEDNDVEDLNEKDWSENPPKVTTILPASNPEPTMTVALAAADPPLSGDEVLWRFIGAISRRMRFDEFRDFVQPKLPKEAADYYGPKAYGELKRLADEFVTRAAVPKNNIGGELSAATVSAAVKKSYVANIDPPSKAYLGSHPYGDEPHPETHEVDDKYLESRFPLLNVPFVELIWNYWMEEGMLVQTMNRILARFQNRRPGPGGDPLLRCNINPLMSLRSFLWPFSEDEQNRLTVRRRAAEYEYEYGLRLRGRAIPHASILSERRSQFIEAFHRLLHVCVQFYKEHDDKTVDADAFPLLSNLQEVHLILARGAHNQFASLAVTARAEMLTMQWLLAQPEMHEFLGGPTMIPYEEPWMERVDTMKSVQRWSDTSITHFYELAVQGEQLLLSIRHGRWNESTRKREDAANWALVHRNPVQRYIANLETVLGIDVKATVDATMPSDLIARRLMRQRSRA
ncbi:hypothetical protein [Rhodococcus sp. A14]|uniref:hypothetical protein n=1 Tax=Rhodococcus sp. A14 TaxID=1194106 RepID=UPI00141D89C3|nr:hypothetical protein [Rhodococcus sp. A14]